MPVEDLHDHCRIFRGQFAGVGIDGEHATAIHVFGAPFVICGVLHSKTDPHAGIGGVGLVVE